MESVLNNESPEVRLRAFRAIDDPAACELFIDGHTRVLTSIGVTKVTSLRNEWTTDPGVFVLLVESLDKQKIYGGARVHVAGGAEPLPIEQATCAMDAAIIDLVWQYAQSGTGELCGLWNSAEISGYGIGSIFLIRAAVAISYQIGLQSLFALCAPYTIKPVENIGMELEPTIGNKGTFYYPKLDLLATAMLLKDVSTLSKANQTDRDAIFYIRENLNAVREELSKKKIKIYYEIQIPNLDRWDLPAIIADAKKNILDTRINEGNPDFV